jgi:hypothetical protein
VVETNALTHPNYPTHHQRTIFWDANEFDILVFAIDLLVVDPMIPFWTLFGEF